MCRTGLHFIFTLDLSAEPAVIALALCILYCMSLVPACIAYIISFAPTDYLAFCSADVPASAPEQVTCSVHRDAFC